MFWLLRVRFCKFWNLMSVFCIMVNSRSNFNIDFIILKHKNFKCFLEDKYSILPGQIFQSCKCPKLGLKLLFFIFSLEMEGPIFSILSYSWVKFSKYSVSLDEPSLHETGSILIDITRIINRKQSYPLWCWVNSFASLSRQYLTCVKNRELEGSEKPAKKYSHLGEGQRDVIVCFLDLSMYIMFNHVSMSIGITELTDQFQKLLVNVITSQAEVYT